MNNSKTEYDSKNKAEYDLLEKVKVVKEKEKENNNINLIVNIINKQILNFSRDPHNLWGRINNEEIMRD